MNDAEHSEAIPIGRPADVTDEEIDAVLAEFGGDPRAAIRALLADIATLAHDHLRSVSLGFVRGEMLGGRLRRRGRRP